MKLEIKETNNGFVVSYWEVYKDGFYQSTTDQNYVYRSVDDLVMLEKIAERFLKRRIKIEEK